LNRFVPASSVGVLAALAGEARSAVTLAECGWAVHVCGVGPERARRAAEQLFIDGVRHLLIWGTAGGLDAVLKPGTLFVPDVIINAADNRRFPVSHSWHARLVQALAPLGSAVITHGALITVLQVIATSADKQALAARTGALMVDMEAAAVAEAAMQAGAEFAVVRALVDAADVALPLSVLAAVGTRHPHRSVITALLKRPQDLPAVLRLGRSFQRAHQTLVKAARALADSHRQ
jgi:adenosylhomocysteine nucleosidase